jgi:hypothetical protein
MRVSKHITQKADARRLSLSDTASTILFKYSEMSSLPRSDFQMPNIESYRIVDPPRKIPPDTEVMLTASSPIRGAIWRPVDHLLKRVAAGFKGESVSMAFDPTVVSRLIDRFWVDAKGVMAIAIASL